MPRSNYNHSASKKNNPKSTPSNSSKKDKKSKQTDSTANPGQRIDGGEMLKEGENILLTPIHSAAIAASPPLKSDTSSMDVSKPIAKPEASIDDKRITSSTSPDEAPITPIHNTTHHTEVTFKSDSVATSIASRRQRSRKSRLGRTSRALSRDEQLMIRWEDEQYHITFNSAKPGADPIARIAITLASGQRVRPGEPLAPDLIDSYLSQLREDLTHQQCEKILRPPPAKSGRTKDRRTRRREMHSDSEDSEEDYVSLLSETSDRHSEVSSKHSGQYLTMNPDGSDSPMESPIELYGGNFVHRREHLHLSAQWTLLLLSLTPNTFEPLHRRRTTPMLL